MLKMRSQTTLYPQREHRTGVENGVRKKFGVCWSVEQSLIKGEGHHVSQTRMILIFLKKKSREPIIIASIISSPVPPITSAVSM